MLLAMHSGDHHGGRDEREERPTAPEVTGIHDLAEVRAQLRDGRQVRDRHLLVCMSGSFVGRVHTLGEKPCVIGRQQGHDVWVPDNGVSRQHASIERDGDGYRLSDLGSANGTYVDGERVTRHLLSDGDLIQLGPAALFRYLVTDADHEKMLTSLYEASVRDPLTGAYNRDYFDERLRAEVAFARRHRTEVALVMFDIDHFKNVNDTYGHPAGDQVLLQLSTTVRQSIRLEDVLVRYGGEEFAVVLRNIESGGVVVLAERLRRLVEAMEVTTAHAVIRITASFGCAALADCSEVSAAALIQVADQRLLRAKREGRNRVAS
jgi:two-component system, cell cycle response regulator